jgi:hypothetical protein
MIIFHARNKPLESLPPSASLSSSSSAAASQLDNETDYIENPLKCPLDVGPLAELGPVSCLVDRQLDRIVRKFQPAGVRLRKTQPDLAVFGVSRDNKKAAVAASKEENSAVRVQFVSPFKRYQLLKPYLDSIERQEEQAQAQLKHQKHLETKPSDIDLR